MNPIPAFSQRDPRWKDKLLGRSDRSIGEYGCLLVDCVMVANYYGFSETPATLNQKMKQAGGFVDALLVPARLSQALPGMRFVDYRKCRNSPAPLAEIDAALAQERPVIVELDYSPKAGLQTHWVVLYARRDGDYLMRDPWPYPPDDGPVGLLERFGFAGDAASTILAVLWLDGPAAPPPPPEEVVASFPLYAAADGLALRSRPVVAADTLIKRMPLNTRLDVLVSDEEAARTVGVVGEWLPVRDPQGARGYAAAWYLSRTETRPEPPPEGPPEAAAVASFPLYAAVNDLALRSRPVVAADTLIKRVPLNTRFEVLTTDEEALPKVGAAGAWLPVRDPQGTRGYAAAWYLTRQPLQPPEPAPAPAGALRVRTTVEGLSFRSQPRILPETLITRLPFRAELTVLEDAGRAQAKIGALNRWLHVRTADGRSGYVAAWYVEALPPGGADDLFVQAAADNLALRSLPRVAPDTLIKRLPLGASLLVLEDAGRARTKIGQFGRWLLVRDPQGAEGYVAAWYVA